MDKFSCRDQLMKTPCPRRCSFVAHTKLSTSRHTPNLSSVSRSRSIPRATSRVDHGPVLRAILGMLRPPVTASPSS